MESWSIGEHWGRTLKLHSALRSTADGWAGVTASNRKDMGNMRKLFLIGLLGITTITGCSSGHSFLASREKERADDPLYSTTEQKRRARWTVPLPLNDD